MRNMVQKGVFRLQKKTILLFLSLMLVLTGCTSNKNKPVNSSTTKPVQKEIPKKEQPTQGSIHMDNPSQTTSEDNSNENEATNDPKEALTKILTELQELDELLNGSN